MDSMNPQQMKNMNEHSDLNALLHFFQKYNLK